MPATPPHRADLHATIVSSLRDLIVAGVLEPGARLDENELCKTFGLSRTPLREAMKVLAAEQFISIVPHRGAYVAPLREAETEELFEVMATLDPLLGARAALHATPQERDHLTRLQAELEIHYDDRDPILYFNVNQDIHRALLEATHMPTLIGCYQPLLLRLRRARTLSNSVPNRRAESIEEHRQILAALLDRDPDRLAALLSHHTRATGLAVRTALSG